MSFYCAELHNSLLDKSNYNRNLFTPLWLGSSKGLKTMMSNNNKYKYECENNMLLTQNLKFR